MIAIAPGYIIAVFQPNYAWVVAILELAKLRIVIDPIDWLMIQLPVDAIQRETPVQVHIPLFIVTAENTCKTVLKWHNRTVKYAVGGWDKISGNDGVLAIPPNNLGRALRSVFPWKIGK
jgi:hypothetical protein